MAQKKTTTSKSKAPPKRAPAQKAAPRARSTGSKAKNAAPKKAQAPAPKPGTTLTRTFKGKAYELKVTKDGFVLGDVTFHSLTAAAKAVTQYPSISGPRFWLGTGTEKGTK